MVFNSLSFALFASAVYCLFLIIPPRLRCGFLLAASYVFYSFVSLTSCAVLAAISLICFFGGKIIHKHESNPRKQLFLLWLLIAILAALLIYFKYFGLVLEQLRHFFTSLKSGRLDFLALVAPIGISFYIFQGIGYLVDVYWGKRKEDNLADFLLFMSFFPKVMLGPIERSDKLLPQIKQLNAFKFNYDQFREALLLFAWGLFKKLVVADRLSLYVNEVYSQPAENSGVRIAVATVFFAFQLLSDFSGYTDMALGLGKLFGIKLTQNFERPYYATNIQDFWRRWHISFTSWIADYVFTPLRMNLRSLGKPGLAICLFATFLLVGAWHGTGWTFIIFGLIHGVYMTVSTFTLRAKDSFWKKQNLLGKFWFTCARQLVTFGLVLFTLVFFRATSVTHALDVLKNLFRHGSFNIGLRHGLDGPELLIAIAMIGFMEITEKLLRSDATPFSRLIARPLWLRWPAYLTLLLAILCFGIFTNPQRFIYFAF